jgi:tetratricopeptide (TPR) repeat protein
VTVDSGPQESPASEYARPSPLRSTAAIYAELGHTLFAEAESLKDSGNEYEARRRMSLAADAFARSLEERPDVPELHRYRAETLEAVGDAAGALSQYLQAAGADRSLDAAVLDRARRLLTPALPRSALVDALAWSEDYFIEQLDPAQRTAMHRFIAQAAALCDDRSAAIVHWQAALAESPEDRDSRLRLADALRTDGQLEAAATVLRAGFDPDERDDEGREALQIRWALGSVLLDIGAAAEAREILEPAEGKDDELEPHVEAGLARAAVLLGAPRAALRHADRALSLALEVPETEAEAHIARARALTRLGRFDEAAQAAESALALSPTHAGAMLARAEALVNRRDDLDQAEHLLRLYLRQHPRDPEGHRLLIRALRALPDRAADVAVAVDAYARIAPTDERVALLTEVARARLSEGDAEGALRRLDEAAQDGAIPPDGGWWLTRAAASGRLSDVSEARAAFAKGTIEGPDDIAVLKLYAEAMTAQDGPAADAALVAWRRLVSETPRDSTAYLGLARALRDVGDLGAALANADEVINLQSGDYESEADASELRAELLERTGGSDADRADALYEAGRRRSWQEDDRRDDAVALLMEAHRLRDDHASTCFHIADLELAASWMTEPPYVVADRVRSALDWWNRGAERETPSGETAWAYLTRAWLEYQYGEIATEPVELTRWRIVVFLERAIAAGASLRVDHWLLLAKAHRFLSNNEVALELLDRLLESDPDNVEVIGERAACLANTGRLKEAQALLTSGMEGTNEAWTTGILAWIQQRLGNDEAALELVREVIDVEPGNNWYHAMLAGELRRLGRRKEAAEAYRALWRDRATFETADTRARAAYAGYALFLLGAESIEAVQQAELIFREACERLEPRVYEALERFVILGLCRITLGELAKGERDLSRAIDLFTQELEFDDFDDELDFLQSSFGTIQRADPRHELLERVRLHMRERRAELTNDPLTPTRELERTLEAVPDPADWSAVGAAASLARREIDQRRWSDAAARYGVLRRDASSNFPEAADAIARVADLALAEGDVAMMAREPERALSQYVEAIGVLGDDPDAHGVRAGVLHARAGFAELKLERDGMEHLGRAAAEFTGSSDESDPYVEAGRAGTEIVGDIEDYWQLDGRLAALDAPTVPDAPFRVRQGLRSYLDERFALSGENQSDLIPMVTPVIMQIGDRLVAQDTSTERWALFTTYIPEMRAALQRDLGIRVPGIRVRGGDPRPGGYTVMIDQAVVARGQVPLDRRWTLGALEDLSAAGIEAGDLEAGRDPRTGEPGAWISEAGCEAAERAGRTIEEDPLLFAVHHLDATIRRYAADFMLLDDTARLLERWRAAEGCNEVIEHRLSDPQARTRLTRVLRALLAETVPITAGETILGVLAEGGLEDDGGARLLAALRRALHEQLPGNEPTRVVRGLPAELEAQLHESLARGGVGSAMRVSPDVAEKLVATVSEWAATPERFPALVTEPMLRPFVREILARQLPQVPVLGSDERAQPTELSQLQSLPAEAVAVTGSQP